MIDEAKEDQLIQAAKSAAFNVVDQVAKTGEYLIILFFSFFRYLKRNT
jgi:hypothetical protein